MTITKAELDGLIQQKIEGDADFQTSLENLSDEEKEQKLEEKKRELFDAEISSLAEQSEKAKKAEELANNYKTRAEKAENALKQKGDGGDPKNPPKDLSAKDTLALIENKVPTDDFDEVVEYANYKKLSVADALKDSTLKTILEKRAEERATAQATQTRSPRGVADASGQSILDKAVKDQVPTDDKDIERLAEARMASRLKK